MNHQLAGLRDIETIDVSGALQDQNVTWDDDCPICLAPLRPELKRENGSDNKGDHSTELGGTTRTALRKERDAGLAEEDNNDMANDDKANNKAEIWRHKSCRKIFHATCVELWLNESCLCSWCRGCLKAHTHNGPVEDRTPSEDELNIEMTLLTERYQSSFRQWSEYWQTRLAQQDVMGAQTYEAQPGYIAQQNFRDIVTQAREQQIQSFNQALTQYRQATSDNRYNMDRRAVTDIVAHIPLQFSTLPNGRTDLNIETVHRQAIGIAHWNLFSARNTTGEDAAVAFDETLVEGNTNFRRTVQEARSQMEQLREDDPHRDEWELDPPNPY